MFNSSCRLHLLLSFSLSLFLSIWPLQPHYLRNYFWAVYFLYFIFNKFLSYTVWRLQVYLGENLHIKKAAQLVLSSSTVSVVLDSLSAILTLLRVQLQYHGSAFKSPSSYWVLYSNPCHRMPDIILQRDNCPALRWSRPSPWPQRGYQNLTTLWPEVLNLSHLLLWPDEKAPWWIWKAYENISINTGCKGFRGTDLYRNFLHYLILPEAKPACKLVAALYVSLVLQNVVLSQFG